MPIYRLFIRFCLRKKSDDMTCPGCAALAVMLSCLWLVFQLGLVNWSEIFFLFTYINTVIVSYSNWLYPSPVPMRPNVRFLHVGFYVNGESEHWFFFSISTDRPINLISNIRSYIQFSSDSIITKSSVRLKIISDCMR